MSSTSTTPLLPFPFPKRPPSTWDVESLRNHLKTAMAIELTTIPLYLAAVYSIIDGQNSIAYKDILDITKQEMLHLTLAGNALRAIDGSQALYDIDFIPTYPNKIFYDNVNIRLGPANVKTIKSFVQVERPQDGEPVQYVKFTVLPDYQSIGEFYASIEQGIEILCPGNAASCELFKYNHDKQFNNKEFFPRSGMITVTDKASALQALKTIVEQGEGSYVDDPKSHYNIFRSLLDKSSQWKCYDYLEDPRTSKYQSSRLIHRLSSAFDALYCYLLQTIDRAWETSGTDARKHLAENIHKIMGIITSLAGVLVAQKLPNGKSPAPCFECYPPTGPPLSAENLHKAVINEILEAAKSGDPNVQEALWAIRKSMDECKPFA